MPTVALVTCSRLPDLHDSERLVIEPLRNLGIDAVAAVWDDPTIDWDAFDLTVIRSAWDYQHRRDEFVLWAYTVPRLANPASVVEWNTDKRYLRELVDGGLRVVHTSWLEPGDEVTLPATGVHVIKPAISAGALNSGRYDLDDEDDGLLARKHIQRLLDESLPVMVQPYVPAIDDVGETGLLFTGGQFSHAIGKSAMLDGPDHGVEGLYRDEEITARVPSEAERRAAEAVLAAVPGADGLLYARVDLVPDTDGEPILLEVELTEPGLFLEFGDGAPERFAAAIQAHLTAD